MIRGRILHWNFNGYDTSFILILHHIYGGYFTFFGILHLLPNRLSVHHHSLSPLPKPKQIPTKIIPNPQTPTQNPQKPFDTKLRENPPVPTSPNIPITNSTTPSINSNTPNLKPPNPTNLNTYTPFMHNYT